MIVYAYSFLRCDPYTTILPYYYVIDIQAGDVVLIALVRPVVKKAFLYLVISAYSLPKGAKPDVVVIVFNDNGNCVRNDAVCIARSFSEYFKLVFMPINYEDIFGATTPTTTRPTVSSNLDDYLGAKPDTRLRSIHQS